MEIKSKLSVTSEQIAKLEMHSVINILSVISGQLNLLRIESNHDNLLEKELEKCKSLSESCSARDKEVLTLTTIKELKESVLTTLNLIEAENNLKIKGRSISVFKENLINVFNVFEVRMMEILHRWESPGVWES